VRRFSKEHGEKELTDETIGQILVNDVAGERVLLRRYPGSVLSGAWMVPAWEGRRGLPIRGKLSDVKFPAI
jgi:hypothetical protein